MAGLFNDIGEFFTGGKATKAEKKQQELANQAAKDAKRKSTQAAAYENRFNQSFGNSAMDYMNNMNAAASQIANQEAQMATRMGTQAALEGARTAGVNRGQAAMVAGQQAGNLYGQNLQQGMQAGRANYAGATQQLANMAGGKEGAAMQAANSAAGQQANMYNQANQQAQFGGGMLTGALDAVGGLFNGGAKK